MKTEFVLCETETEFSYVIWKNISLQRNENKYLCPTK